jgi:hypothetical protein
MFGAIFAVSRFCDRVASRNDALIRHNQSSPLPRPYSCTINMYLICMCWLRRVGTVKIEDRGAEKPATIDPKFGFIRGIPGFIGSPFPLGVIQ